MSDPGQVAFRDGSITQPTPCLVIDEQTLDHNLAAMSTALPATRLRPHVKAFKSTDLARRLHGMGHAGFTCATVAEMAGMVNAGLGEDLLLANETLDADALRSVQHLADTGATPARLTIAIDSAETLAVAAAAGVRDVLVDVNVGLPRCGCAPGDAGGLAADARAAGLNVRGVMGYEGHLMMVEDRDKRVAKVASSMAQLAQAAAAVAAVGGGPIISAGGTGTFDTNNVATEIQAGSFTLMDTQYATLDIPFRQALFVEATVISINPAGGWIVADSGIKSLSMDHGDPHWEHGAVMFCSDEHVTLAPTNVDRWTVGDRIRLAPAHVDPTVAKHERMWLVGADDHVTEWPVDLRHW